MRTSTLLGILVIAVVTLLGEVGQGGGVVTNCTEVSLRAALAGGGTVLFACDGTISLNSGVAIANDTLIDASGHQVVISGNGSNGVFLVSTNVQFSVKNLAIANGLATNGGGLFNAGGTVIATNCTFNGNKALGIVGGYGSNGQAGLGGAVANLGVLYLFNCSFTNNSADGGAGGYPSGYTVGMAGGDGAGGAVWNAGFVLINGCTFADNSAVGGAGGQGAGAQPLPFGSWPGYNGGPGGNGAGAAVCNNGTAYLVNCTLAFNEGVGGAGGMGGPGYTSSPDYPPASSGQNGPPGLGIGGISDVSGQCYITNCTLAYNSDIGIGTTATNGAKLINTLLCDNLPDGNAWGNVIDLGHNLSSDLTCGFTNAGSMNNTYPLLGPLTNNGGSTLTIALLTGCRAIDAGDTLAAPSTDQRGVSRPFGSAADIGAYEYNASTNSVALPVVTECTAANLRAAMSGGGHVTFACDGSIVLSNTVTMTTNTLLDAASHQIILQASGGGLFQVSPNVTFSVANLTIAGGSGPYGAGIWNKGGSVNATNCVFVGNIASLGGGAIQNDAGLVSLSGCLFNQNYVLGAGGGGGALNNLGSLTADLCTFAGNSALGNNGATIYSYGSSGGPGQNAVGGAIRNLGTLTISRSTFTNNNVVGGNGGSGYVGHHGDLSMNGGPGGNGGAGGNALGGALYNAGTAQVSDSTFALNLATGGNGGIGGDGGPSYGWAAGGGGGIGGTGGNGVGAVFNSGTLQIVNSTFAFNPGSGGNGARGGNGGSGVVGGSGGTGGNGGSGTGALDDETQPSLCTITNSTIAGNSGWAGMAGAGGAGGSGTYQGGSPGSAGMAGVNSGGMKTTGGQLINTLLTVNLPGGNGTGVMIDLGHNLSSDATCAFTHAGSMNNIAPQLGPLANYGGPTLTMALLPNSPAIDAGDDTAAPDQDQRGLPRPIGRASDIGAFEYGSPALLTPSRPTAGGIDLMVIGKRGQPCHLQGSDTLLDWVTVSTNQFDTNGTALFHDDIKRAQRFYRVSLP